MAPATEDGWDSLFRWGGIAAIIAGLSVAANEVLQFFLQQSFQAFNPTGEVVHTPQYLTFIFTNMNLFNALNFTEAATVVAAVPALASLYFALVKRERGLAVVGTSLALLGVLTIVGGVAMHIFQVQEAAVFDAGCTVCAAEATVGGTSAFAAGAFETLGDLTFLIGILALSAAMLRGRTFGKAVPLLGVLSFVVGVAFQFLPDFGQATVYVASVPFFVVALWFFGVGYRSLRLAKQT